LLQSDAVQNALSIKDEFEQLGDSLMSQINVNSEEITERVNHKIKKMCQQVA
jgi:hypothetical protein